MMFPSNYTDKNMMITPHGENKILFSCIYHYLLKRSSLQGEQRYFLRRLAENYLLRVRVKYPYSVYGYTAEYTWEDGYNNTKPLKEPWSHDNHTALICLSMLYNLKVYRFPLRDSWRRLHPRDIAFYLISSSNYLAKAFGYALSPLLVISMTWACGVNNPGTIPGTINHSGRQLAWLRCEAMGWHKLQNMLEWVMKTFQGMTWKQMLREYYKDPNHPNVVLSKEVL